MSEEMQIEEITKVLDSNCEGIPDAVCQENSCSSCKARQIIGIGYRKQSKGEWVKNDHGDNICSCCRLPANYKSRYCPDCGAKLKD